MKSLPAFLCKYLSSITCSYLMHFLSPSKKIHPKKFLYFLIFRKTETTKKIPYISGNGSTKKLLIFREMELLSPGSKNKKSSFIFLYFREWNFLALILRNFLYFLKIFLIFQETETLKKFFIF